MLSIYDISEWVNDLICGTIPGAKVYGIARQASRDGTLMPVFGEEFIGIDDTHPAIAYHRHLSISSQVVANTGYGDVERYLQNNHQMILVLFFDESKCGYAADQLYTIIQSKITGVLKFEGYKSVRIGVTNAVLNDGQVWSQEYGTATFRLHVHQRLIQIGYNVVMTLSQNCISIPNCKN